MATKSEQGKEETPREDTSEVESEDGTVDESEPTNGETGDEEDGENATEDGSTDQDVRKDIAWLKSTLETIVKGQEVKESSRPATRQNRTRVRVVEQPAKEPPPPPPPPRNVRKLEFRGFGLRKARNRS